MACGAAGRRGAGRELWRISPLARTVRLAVLALAVPAALAAGGEEPPPFRPGEGWILVRHQSDAAVSGWVVRNDGGLQIHIRVEKVVGRGVRPGDIIQISRPINTAGGSAVAAADRGVAILKRFAPGSQVEVTFFHTKSGGLVPAVAKVLACMPPEGVVTGAVTARMKDPGSLMIEVQTLPKDAAGPKGLAVPFQAAEAPGPEGGKPAPDPAQLEFIAGLQKGEVVEVAYKIDAHCLRIRSLKRPGDAAGTEAAAAGGGDAGAAAPAPDAAEVKPPAPKPAPAEPAEFNEEDF